MRDPTQYIKIINTKINNNNLDHFSFILELKLLKFPTLHHYSSAGKSQVMWFALRASQPEIHVETKSFIAKKCSIPALSYIPSLLRRQIHMARPLSAASIAFCLFVLT